MANKSYNDIRSIAEDWQYDDRNGLKYSGKSVQKFIKGQLQEKVAASYFDSTESRLYGFRSVEDRDRYVETKDASLIIDTCLMNFTGMQYRVVIDNLMGSTQLYFTTNQSSAIVRVGFKSQEKGITDFEWKDKVEDFIVSVAIDKGAQGNYETIKADETVINGNTYSIDIKNLLISGANRLKFTATGKDTGATTTLVYTVILTSMYIAPSNFTWYKPYIEGESYTVGGLNIGGNLSKELVIKVSAENYEPEPIRVPLGSNTYTDLAYNYTGLPFPSKGTGVYNLEIWVDAGGVQTDHLSYNIICVSQEDKHKARLVCIGHAEKTVTNFSDNKYFEYCVYNGGTAQGEPTISLDATVNSNSINIVTETLSVPTATAIAFERSLEIEAEEAELKLVATMSYDDNEQRVVFAVDNSKSYPATSGAVFYLNPSTRSNAQANRETIINAANDTAISAVWTKMAWSDGADGYTVDDEGRKCLKLPAGSKVNINYQPMKQVGRNGKTIEFVYRVKNASDYNEPIISICDEDNPNNPKFRGVVIRPKNILLHSRDLNVQDTLQDYNTTDEDLVIVAITIVPNYKTNYGNLAQMYVNGDKKRSFSFESTDSWDNIGNIIFGSETADLYIYKMRVYDRGFDKVDAMKNYTNALGSAKEKDEFTTWNESCVDDSFGLDYKTCVKNGLSTMVIELLDGKPLPDLLNQNKAQCNLHLDIRGDISMLDEELQRLFRRGDINKITEWLINQTIEGQGSTAMGYYRWNFRWKLDDNYGKRRITAKKNVASSMHSHKMGATRMFNYLHKECVGANDANADVAVTQFPVFGFIREKVEGTDNQYTYKPIGLYTIGADKGDKHTFGYDNKEFKETLIHLEGADHTPKGVGYDYPWDAMRYSGEKEALGPVDADGSVIKAFECGACGTYSPDEASDEENVYTMLGQEFRPAYDVAYLNSTYIHGVPQTLAEINNNVTEWRKQTYNGVSYENLEFYTHGIYDLYYFNEKEKVFKATGINVVGDLGLDIQGLTEEQIEVEVIKRRKARFVEQWGNYWNTKDAIFTFCFILLIAATDNFKKNLYPYKFKSLADGGKWCHRNDDLDTIFDINNQGRSGKRYSVLVGDTTETGSVFRGDNSVFWTLVKETQQDAIKKMMGDIFKAMINKAIAVGYSGTPRQQLIGCIRHFFWDNAQEYFPASAYNADAEWTYEDAWALNKGSVAPLTQSLGNHYEAEYDFVAMRMLFLASIYNFAPFNTEADEDDSEGQLKYRGSSSHTYRITTAADFRPMIITGESSSSSTDGRVESGQTVDIIVPGTSGADTTISIQGLDWIADLGDMSSLVVSADDSKLSITSKRLNRVKVGDEDPFKVTSNIKTLDIGLCPSMTSVNAQNLKSLTGTISLANLPRLREALFGGTDVRSIDIPRGAKIEKLQIPTGVSVLKFQDLKYLREFNYDNLANVEDMRVEGCDSINAFDLLGGAYFADKSQLKNIRITDFTADGDATDMDMLANLVNDKDKDGNDHQYNGIDADGNVGTIPNPVIDGTFNATTPTYEDSLEVVRSNYPNLVINESGVYYQRFKDKEVFRVLLANNVGDGLGVVKEDWANLKDIGLWFSENKEIVSLPELVLTNITHLKGNAFFECTSLKDIDCSKVTSMNARAFYKCTALSNIKLGDVTSLGGLAFFGCINLEADISFPNLTGEIIQIFEGSGILSCSIPKVSALGNYCFSTCENLTSVDISSVTELKDYVFINCYNLATVIGSNIKSMGSAVFLNCASLTTIDIPLVKTIGARAFEECTSLTGDFDLPQLISLGNYAFRKTAINSINISNAESIGFNTFQNCTSLESANMPKVNKVPDEAFRGCSSLVSIDISNATQVGYASFYGCESLLSADMPNVVTIVGTSGFSGCTSLTEINAPLLKSTGSQVFYNCSSLIEVDFPMLVEVSGTCFKGCAALKRVSIPNAINIQNDAFYQCAALQTVNIPKVETISSEAFTECTSLKEVVAGNLKEIGSYAFAGNSALTTIDLSTVIKVGSHALRLCTSLESVEMPLVESIGGSAFDGCSSLVSVNVPKVSQLGSMVFRNCKLLSDVDLSSVQEIGINAFEGCTSLVNVDVSSAVEIPTAAFYGCSALESVDASNAEILGSSVFLGCNELKTIQMSNVVTMGSYVFDGCKELSGDFNLPLLVSMSGYCFRGTKITSFTAPLLKGISTGSFDGCSSLTLVDIPLVENINNNAFVNATKLVGDYNLPNLTSLGSNAFRDTAITSFIAPNLTTILTQTFYSCNNLAHIEFPNVTTIGTYAFQYCTSLQAVEFDNLTSISEAAFADCSKLRTFILRATTPPAIGVNIFFRTFSALTIYVPDTAVDTYKNATGWADYASKIKGISELPTE